jgi:hypothetical protein
LDIRDNAFERLSLLAARERWCWNLRCTTCGNMVFRWALKAIAKGLHPDHLKWSVHWGRQQTSETLAAMNGPLPPAGGWPEEEQCAIQDASRGCILANVIRAVPFPDWLGHVGVLLRYTEDAERNNLMLTQELAPQFLELVEAQSAAESMLRQRLEAREPLRWNDLEFVERCYRGRQARGDSG